MAESTLVGRKAPPFTLLDQDGNEVRVADLAGEWVVLYFYPKDDTPGCTTEAKEFTSTLAEFGKLGARVFGCSPDSPQSHREFRSKYQLRIPLLSDPDHTVMAEYGAWGEKNNYGRITEGVIRSTVLIDPEGRVAHHWPRVKAAGHADRVHEKLAELQEA